jgi:hypothetical protein
MRKIGYNESSDLKQFEQYKKWLGDNAPESFEAFQTLKYSDNWGAFKAYTRSIKSGELTPLADFNLYQVKSREIDTMLIGKATSNGITIAGKSDHFIARTIGSVEQKRSGVDVQTALNVLSQPTRVDPIKHNANGSSQRFIGKGAAVTINPKTGRLIQVNPLTSKG